MGDNFEAQITNYFKDFKESMKKRLRIPVSLVEKHVNDVGNVGGVTERGGGGVNHLPQKQIHRSLRCQINCLLLSLGKHSQSVVTR